jgi:hypothetical protein
MAVKISSNMRPVFGIALVAAALAVALPTKPASAQGIFESLFGSPKRTSAPAYADPNSQLTPFGRPADPNAAPAAPRAASSPSVSYCVRLCDGRFFPIQKSSGADPVETCSNFCPAARTKVYSGGGIEHAVARDGSSYAKLDTAFVYRDKIVPNCTCNGRDAFGLVNTTVANDPTLRSGDIVAGENGFMAYSGGSRKNAEFTPITKSSVTSELRQKLATAKIVPRNATPVPTPEQFAVMRAATDDGAGQADRKRASRRATAQR